MAAMNVRVRRAMLLAFAAALAPCILALPASADESERPPAVQGETDDAVTRAREAFVRGTTLAKRGEWREALAAFELSAAAKPHAVTLYNLGYCERALGRYTRARKRFVDALRRDDAGKGERMPEAMRRFAEKYLADVDERIARVSVTLEPVDAEVVVDGRPLEPAGAHRGVPRFVAGTRDTGEAEVPGAARFELWIDPGRHVFVVSRPGAPDRVEIHDVASTRNLALIAHEPPVAPASRLLPPREVIDPMTWPALAYAVGGVGVTVAGVFGVATLQRKAHLDEICGTEGTSCPPGSEAEQKRVRTHAIVSTVGLGFAVVGAALGTTLVFVLADDETGARVELDALALTISGRL
jgi:hypothetical protein